MWKAVCLGAGTAVSSALGEMAGEERPEDGAQSWSRPLTIKVASMRGAGLHPPGSTLPLGLAKDVPERTAEGDAHDSLGEH